jgi:hypothetical protein
MSRRNGFLEIKIAFSTLNEDIISLECWRKRDAAVKIKIGG